ncbi:DUF2141 domain-containing protein [Flavobacteriaceae bacterium TP-CH-4]|uniref:DUF2141 domain-containing protein n=1 Tax=Pelagihabitans pacificus TaxID=2696054 RepID=A0A967AT75_9FLAO|nr:DUF2141 domain-containing protein [Pelagihabitans pacificus]NHF59574.1 DUF2141 domain-containing protein [Pelagihabitans pacificus]
MKRYFFVVLALLFGGIGLAQETGDLTIRIDVVKNKGKGQLVFLLFDQEEGFPREADKAKYRAKIKKVVSKMSHTFTNIPYGEYAVCVFHDENENGAIDTNFMGMPKEHVAASNMTGMGRPSFKKCEINLGESKMSVELDFIND